MEGKDTYYLCAFTEAPVLSNVTKGFFFGKVMVEKEYNNTFPRPFREIKKKLSIGYVALF